MITIEFFDRKGYNPKYETIGGEVLMDGICVGEWQWNWPRTRIIFMYGYCCDTEIFKSFEDAAKHIVNCGRFDHDYDIWNGAYHRYFDTKKGYDHIANYYRCFPLVEKYTITYELKHNQPTKTIKI